MVVIVLEYWGDDVYGFVEFGFEFIVKVRCFESYGGFIGRKKVM